jgi:hypothetical protein
MEDQGIAAIGIDEAVFGSPAQAGNPCSRKSLPEIDRKSSPEIGPARFDPLDSVTFEDTLKPANGCLDFGKLRHRGDMAKPEQPR